MNINKLTPGIIAQVELDRKRRLAFIWPDHNGCPDHLNGNISERNALGIGAEI